MAHRDLAGWTRDVVDMERQRAAKICRDDADRCERLATEFQSEGLGEPAYVEQRIASRLREVALEILREE